MKKHIPQEDDLQQANILGNAEHRSFLNIQSSYGFARRGGSLSLRFRLSACRLISDINLLHYYERKLLVYSEFISKN
jgi:hypothetical protein